MKNIIKHSGKWLLGGMLCLTMMTACDLNYENRGDIVPDDVWKNKTMILAYLNDIHGGQMPGWPGGSDNNDEAMRASGTMGDWARGVIDAEKDGKGLDYGYIDKINFLLMKLKEVPTSVLTETENEQIQGQALFWRAWNYWGKVSEVGGVPMITEWQDVTDRPSLFVPRNSTSQCMEQILKDLDAAIKFLPDAWDDTNYGRIDKGAAMAYKGRLLMNYASPLFNRQNDKKRWEDAYQANMDAITFLKKMGKDMYPDFKQLWYDEQNEEVIMVNQFFYPGHSFDQKDIRPAPFGTSNSQPILSLLLAFPQKDGSPLVLDEERFANDPAYNADFLTRFYKNRDDRFYSSIFVGGTRYPSMDDAPGEILDGQNYWCTWMAQEDGSYISMILRQLNTGVDTGVTGFFQRKGIDESLKHTTQGEAETDWVEIRFTEVLMNMAECANEIGKGDEALDVIYKVRKRAGIEAGMDNHYGVTASSQDEIREALMNERMVEFAFEGKRGGDLRRWMRWGKLNEMKHRQGLYLVLNDNKDVETFDWKSTIMDDNVRSKFHGVYIENLDLGEKYTFNFDLNHWFYPINKESLDRNSKLEQNNEWGGTFDPLK